MKTGLYKLTKHQHLDNLLAKLPIVTLLYVAQCWVMSSLITTINIGDYALFLAICLISFVASLYFYDKHHHIILCEDSIEVYTDIIGAHKSIDYNEIQKISVLDIESDFGPMKVHLSNGESYTFHFLDFPQDVKSFINTMIKPKTEDFEEVDKEAA